MALTINKQRYRIRSFLVGPAVRSVALLGLLAAHSARADSGLAAKQSPEFLVLGFLRDGKQAPAVRAAVANRISEQNQWRERHPEMLPEELRCDWDVCGTLIARYGKADYLVWGTIKKQDGPLCPGTGESEKMTIIVTVVDAMTVKPNADSPQEKRTRDFASCDATEVAAATADLVQELLVGKKSPLGASRLPGFVPPPPLCPEDMQRFGTGFAQGAFLGLGASALVAGAGLHNAIAQTDLTATSMPSGTQVGYNWQPLRGYETAAWSMLPVAAAGSGLSALGLLRHRSSDVSSYCRNRRRWTYGRGWAVGMFSSLLLSTLITKWTFTTQSGSACIAGRSDSSCSFATQIGVGWGFSVAWTIGLGLSLGLPSREEK